MIDNFNASKTAPSGDFLEIEKYIGVASINIKAINPDNEKLRSFGWNLAPDADEPVYSSIKEVNGKNVDTARIRFFVQIQDLESKPIVAMDFWVKNAPMVSNKNNVLKCKVIDSFGRTAWATEEEFKAHKIPKYETGPAPISSDYKLCHFGQEELVKFIAKFLNITPLQIYDKKKDTYVNTQNPGHITIDDWAALCRGDVSELVQDIALQPENRVKVIFGLQETEDNKTYQTFINSTFIGNGASVNRNTGEYDSARTAIDKYNDRRSSNGSSNFVFSASPVRVWENTASTVEDNAKSAFDFTATVDNPDEDLPF